MGTMNETARVTKKIRKGDTVIVIAGNSRGMSGTILSCMGEKAIVQGLNVRKRHMKGQRNQPGQIVELERPIHISNLKLCDAKGNPIKLHVRTNDQGEREFYYNDGQQDVLFRPVKKPTK